MTAPAKYRKKPVVIEAMQLTGLPRSQRQVADWIEQAGGSVELAFTGSVVIRTLEGNMRADVGDWIIRGVNGEFYPCKPDIFEKTYELVAA